MADPTLFDHLSSNGFYPCSGDVAEHLPDPLDFSMLVDDIPFPDTNPFPFTSSDDLDFDLQDLDFTGDLHFDPAPAYDLPYDTQHAVSEPDSPVRALSNEMSGSKILTPQVDFPPPALDDCENLSSQGSGDVNSGVFPVETPPSPNTCQSVSHFSSSSNMSVSHAENCVISRSSESKIKIEEAGRQSTHKRKTGQDDDEGSTETRASKSIKSSAFQDNELDDKKSARLTRNRESAHLSRQRKKHYVEVLEDKVKFMNSTITDLNSKVDYIIAENALLRQRLSGGGVCPPPPPLGMYPSPPMGYPWMPYPAYLVKPQGSYAPLLPIPRLKPQQAGSPSKASKKSEHKKNLGKTKKVASVSFLGLLFFIFLFGGLSPVVHFKYGDKLGVAVNLRMTHKGRILMVDDNVVDNSGKSRCKNDSGVTVESVHVSNCKEPLAASLFVPKNDRLVKIDGNLILHSVLASEKAKASLGTMKMKTSEETRLAIARKYVPSFQVTGGAGINTRGSHIDDGRVQQWFHEDLSSSMLSSGMCTEVFQFDVSPTPGSLVPVSTITNTSSRSRSNLKKLRNRRILSEHSTKANLHVLNFTEEHAAPKTEKRGLDGNKSRSSMIVSVLVDPRESGEGDVEGAMRSKSLSRVLVVVLTDSVKYVTYSCPLPLIGPTPHSHLVKT